MMGLKTSEQKMKGILKESNSYKLICGRYIKVPEESHVLLLMLSIIAVAGLLRAFLKHTRVPILAVLLIFGFIVGQVGRQYKEVSMVIYPILATNNYALFHFFTPLIIFMAAMDMDFYILKKLFWQVAMLGCSNFFMTFILIGYFTLEYNKYKWELGSCLLFGVVLGITDPLLAVRPLKNLGVPKMLIDLIRGEALASYGIASVILGILKTMELQSPVPKEMHILLHLCHDIFGSILFGFWCSKIVQYLLSDIFSDTVADVNVCFSMTYFIFYVAEWLGMSGVVSIMTLGLLLDSISFRPGIDVIVIRFLILLTFLCQAFICSIIGIILGCEDLSYLKFHSGFFTILTYFILSLVRVLTILLVSPLLMNSGFGFNWRWGCVIVCSGIKGSLCLISAPAFNDMIMPMKSPPQAFLAHIVAATILTMVLNSELSIRSSVVLGLCVVSIPRQMAVHNAIRHIGEMVDNTIALSKTEKILTNVIWTKVEEITKIEYPVQYMAAQIKQNLGEEDMSNIEEDLLEEARMHVSIIQMSSFEKQCKDGNLNEEAARILIGASKSYSATKGKFMSIHDVSTYVKTKSVLMRVKNLLLYLVYSNEREKFTPPKSKFAFLAYHIVFSDEFEYAGHILSLLYVYPMMMHLLPVVRAINVIGLIIVNYYFVLLYITEAVLKIAVMKRKYFSYSWNQMELFIIVHGLVDIFFVHFVTLIGEDPVIVQITTVLEYFRFFRFLRIFKMILPTLIELIEAQIKKRLSLMYSLTKGYIRSQEDIKRLIRQIAGQEPVSQKLYEILEKNKEEAIKELGLIEHECRDVVIALKTKQAIRSVLGKALKNLRFLRSRGIIDKIEGTKMNKIFLSKIKELNHFPTVIPPPTPEKFLHHIVWLEDKDVLIEFFKEKAHLACFDYGAVICKEGEMPQGIYLIISGMASLHGTRLKFGIDPQVYHNPENTKMSFTDYCTSGDIIGELSCLLKQELEFTATCETILQACFISLEDLYEGFDVFWPFLEYKMWLKIALNIASQYFEEYLASEELAYQKVVEFNNIYVETLLSYNELTIYDNTMEHVFVVHGSVIDVHTEAPYYAPCLIPKNCTQIQGTSEISKLLVVRAPESVLKSDSSLQGLNEEQMYLPGRQRRGE
uniref:Solute carrier family 9 member C2 (putative) n=1 Tax=Ornithorhynchus anatinus TaxID=9258 RepID=A0A6I8PGK4_ORNAN